MCEGVIVYIFGYGSLIWRPGFPYVRKFDGYIKGWARYFWQSSSDHRGTPEEPGRVVTLVRDDGAVQSETWGTVYCVPEEEAEVILKNLDYREKGGYTREEVDVYIRGYDMPVVKKAILYVGTEKNSCYVGESPVEDIAHRIYKCVGPSGPNVDYLLNLADSMRKMNVCDPHVADLERIVRELVLLNPLPHHTHPSLQISSPTGSPDTLFRSPIAIPEPKLLTVDSTSTAKTTLQRKYFFSPSVEVKGSIYIDDGAVMAVSQRGRSLLPAGIMNVQGSFLPQDLISIVNKHGVEISRGITFYSSDEIYQIKGLHSSKVNQILGFTRGEAVVHNQNLILI
jgi:cation transport regulator ChaC